MLLTFDNFRKRIELSLCQQFADDEDVCSFCEAAKRAEVGVVCINPVNVDLVSKLLKNVDIEISGNIGFPFGSHLTEVKVLESRKAVEDGATQIDVVINVGALRSKKDDIVFNDIKAVVEAAQGRIVKTIIETWVLNREEKERACRVAEKAGAHCIKTTTGVKTQYLTLIKNGQRGAVVADIILMRNVLQSSTKIKASGGIYTLDYAVELIKAGADQLGVSKGEQIIQAFKVKYGDSIEIERDSAG